MESMDVLDFSSQELTDVPESVLNSSQAQTLILDFNDLTSLSSLFCEKLQFLSCLSLNGNALKELPFNINLLTKLSELYVKENYLFMLPENIGKLKSLKKLHLTGNDIKELPKNFCLLQNLVELIANENVIVQLPCKFGNLSLLSYLDLSNNDIQSLPTDFGCLKNLKILNLSYNFLTYLPESFQNLPCVEIIDLATNRISELPKTFSSSKVLKKLFLTNNSVVILPEWFSELENVIEIYLGCNCLQEMPFPDNFGTNCVNLELLDLSGNSITSLPDDIGELKRLTIFDLGSSLDELERNRFLANGNSLSFLPNYFSGLKSLTKLELDENKILELPNDFGCLSNITYLDLSHNILKVLPESFCHLHHMKVCMLSMNYLTCLPSNFGLLSSLEDLKLDNNMLVELPGAFENLTRLSALDLYSNKLSEIPKVLDKLTCLKHLDLRENDFDLAIEEVPVIAFEPTYPSRNPELSENWRGRKRHDIQPSCWVEKKEQDNCTGKQINNTLLNALNSSSALWRKHGQDNIRNAKKFDIGSENMTNATLNQNSACELTEPFNKCNLDDMEIKIENDDAKITVETKIYEGSADDDIEYWDDQIVEVPFVYSSSTAENTGSFKDNESENSFENLKGTYDKNPYSSDSSDWETDSIYHSVQGTRSYKYPTECEHSDSCPHFIPSKIQAPRILPVEIWFPIEDGQFDDDDYD